MKLPYGYDPLSVNKIALNTCYFTDPGLEVAVRRAGEIFPNAEIVTVHFDEDLNWGVLELHPLPERNKIHEIYVAVEDLLPLGPYSGMPFDDEGDLRGQLATGEQEEFEDFGHDSDDLWTPPDPEAWKNS